ncbi:trans-resveratrol di-O-methyltransferase-like [Gossypium australe]|uniref:Trans-resveratrol di-O-methyltransferase-like n=1 Tax=Gossypium australe TaxID=47621 RepID=A0A5B6WPS2_9ROSI|nr:trans-resveratrol di-O-methyltransferase-like [Gossypium australe]
MSGEMIENAIRSTREKTLKSQPQERKKNKMNTVSVYNKIYSKLITIGQPKAVTTSHQGPSKQESN